MEKPNFHKKTWALIGQLKKEIATKRIYPTLGHFYREIELLKFPYLKKQLPGSKLHSKHGRNIYTQQQYDPIVRYCEENEWVTIDRTSRPYTVRVKVRQTVRQTSK